MKKSTLLLTFLSSLLLTSCTGWIVGDGALRLKGQILVGESAARDCTLELRLARTGEAVVVRPVESSFELTLVVDPLPRRYFVHIWCQGHADTYDSPVFKSRGLKTFYEPVDLGTIQLEARGPGGGDTSYARHPGGAQFGAISGSSTSSVQE